MDLYKKLGKRDGIIKIYIDEMTADLPTEGKEKAAQILDRLAPSGGIKMSYPLDILKSDTGLGEEHIAAVLQHWDKWGVVRARSIGPMATATQSYELRHDAFIVVLRPWIEKQLREKREREEKEAREKKLEEEELARKRRRRRMLPGVVVGIGVLLLLVVLSLQSLWKEEQLKAMEYQLTDGLVTRLRKLPEEGRRKPDAVFDVVASYLWSKEDGSGSEKLWGLLKKNQDLVKFYQATPKQMSKVDPKENWPVTLAYNPKRGLDENQLLYSWESTAKKLSETLISVPSQLKFKQDPKLPENEVRVEIRESTEETLKVASTRDGFYIAKKKTEPRLAEFLDRHRIDLLPLDNTGGLGPGWLAPHWSFPLLKEAGIKPLPTEEILTQALAVRMRANPKLLITPDLVELLLKREEWQYPQTIKEAKAARGEAHGVAAVLAELAAKPSYGIDGMMAQLWYMLDGMGQYSDWPPAQNPTLDGRKPAAEKSRLPAGSRTQLSPGDLPTTPLPETPSVSPEKVVERLLEDDLASVPEVTLSGPRGGPPTAPVSEGGERQTLATAWTAAPEEETAKPSRAYDNSLLPEPEPPVRVYLGRALVDSLVSEKQLKPEVQEAILELRKKLYMRYGVFVPGVKFRVAEPEFQDNQFRIELFTEKKTSGSIEAPPEQALPIVMAQLELRFARSRTRWLLAEHVYGLLQELPADLRDWLETNYSLTDLKVLMRKVIAPDKSELNSLSGGEATPARPLRYTSWLLGSLPFWTSVCALDGNCIAERLRNTQDARLGAASSGLPATSVIAMVKNGIDTLERGGPPEAERIFKEAVALDTGKASEAFLALYPRSARAFQQKWLEGFCPLPAPGRDVAQPGPNIPARYELEEWLGQAGERLNPEYRPRLVLCLLWSDLRAKKENIAQRLEPLLSQRDISKWSPDEQYWVGYWLLKLHNEGAKPPANLGRIEKLLSNAFTGLPGPKAEQAFDALMQPCIDMRAGAWCWSMLGSLSDLHRQSYWIALQPGIPLAWQRDKHAKEALALFKRAESNLAKVLLDDRPRAAAWLDFGRAVAHSALAEYGKRESFEQAKKLLMNLVENPAVGSEGWPAVDDVYGSLFDAYIRENDLARAARVIDEGLNKSPASTYLLQQNVFVHLAQGHTDTMLKLGQEAVSALKDNDDALYLAALTQVLTRKGPFEETARKFLATKHQYRDYIRMMLYWSLGGEGDAGARQLIDERWNDIDSNWKKRSAHTDPGVWTEMLIGYYAGDLSRDEILLPIRNPRNFERSGLRNIGQPLSALQCEAYFYAALREGVSGELATRVTRQLDLLRIAEEIKAFSLWEYHMARYLLNELEHPAAK